MFSVRIPWEPGVPEKSSLRKASICWARSGPQNLQVAGVTGSGDLYWTQIIDAVEINESQTLSYGEDFLCVDFIQAGKFAAVTASNRLHWLRASTNALVAFAPIQTLHHPSPAVATFTLTRTNEVAVIFQDGKLLCVRIPGA